MAVSVTPRQIINQSLSHFFHNEKSIVLCAFRYYNIPARKKVHARRKKKYWRFAERPLVAPHSPDGSGETTRTLGIAWHLYPRISSTAISPGILSRMPFVHHISTPESVRRAIAVGETRGHRMPPHPITRRIPRAVRRAGVQGAQCLNPTGIIFCQHMERKAPAFRPLATFHISSNRIPFFA